MNNRAIKFRAWYDGRMIKESFCEHLSGYGCMFNQFTKPDALMQFTGLHDKNGVEIYEGDIISGRSMVFGELTVMVGLSKYDDPEEYMHQTHYGWNCAGIPLVDLIKDGLEVIGNIYENHELLGCDQ